MEMRQSVVPNEVDLLHAIIEIRDELMVRLAALTIMTLIREGYADL